jgi:hypothetical protein
LARAKEAETKNMAEMEGKPETEDIIPGGVGSMTGTLIWISQKEVWSKSLVHQVLIHS